MKKTYNSPEVFVHVLTVETVMLAAVSKPNDPTEGMKQNLGHKDESQEPHDHFDVVLGKDDDIVL